MNIGRPGIITNVCVSTRRRERERERFLCTSMLEAPLIPRPDWHYWKRAYCTGLIFFAPFSSCSLTFSFKATYSFLLFSYSSIFFFFFYVYIHMYTFLFFFFKYFFLYISRSSKSSKLILYSASASSHLVLFEIQRRQIERERNTEKGFREQRSARK